MIKVIIFDYDGVIVNSFPKVHEVYQTICEKLGKKCPKSLEGFKKIYGYNSRELAKNLSFSEDDTKKADIVYKAEILKKDPGLFTGIKEVLDKLKKEYKLVLISSSPRNEVIAKMNIYGLIGYFDLIFASEEAIPMRKPKAIKETLGRLKVNTSEIIMIGDRIIDYDEGTEAGLKSENIILVEYGWGYDKGKVPKQKMIIKKPLDLIDAINKVKHE
jgi:phosphoglycolate phosphatase